MICQRLARSLLPETDLICDFLVLQKEKPKLSMGDSAKFLWNSTYVRDLATLVVAYGISINLVEVTWKSKLKAQVMQLYDVCVM